MKEFEEKGVAKIQGNTTGACRTDAMESDLADPFPLVSWHLKLCSNY